MREGASDGDEIRIGRREALALLAFLATEGGRHSRESLATLLSPEFDTSGARAELRRTLSVLNNILGEGRLTGVDHPCAGVDGRHFLTRPESVPPNRHIEAGSSPLLAVLGSTVSCIGSVSLLKWELDAGTVLEQANQNVEKAARWAARTNKT